MEASRDLVAAGMSTTDLRLFAKSVLLLDSPEEGEAASALLRVRALSKKGGARFCEVMEQRLVKEAVWEAHGRPSWLEAYFESEKNRLEYERLEKQCDRLSDAVTELKEAGAFCRSCESKRRWLAAIAGCALAWTWFRFVAHGDYLSRVGAYGLLISAFPFASVWCRWRLLKLKRRLRWQSGRENRLADKIRQFWR